MLDSGQQFRAHSAYLRRASQALNQSILQLQTQVRQPLILKIHAVSDRQLLLLLHALYELHAADWAGLQPATNLWDLARASHAMECTHLLSVADKALMKLADAHMYGYSVLEVCHQSWQLGLKGMQYQFAIVLMGCAADMNADDLAVAAAIVPLILLAARDEAVDMLSRIEACNKWGLPHASQGAMLRLAGDYKAELQARIP